MSQLVMQNFKAIRAKLTSLGAFKTAYISILSAAMINSPSQRPNVPVLQPVTVSSSTTQAPRAPSGSSLGDWSEENVI